MRSEAFRDDLAARAPSAPNTFNDLLRQVDLKIAAMAQPFQALTEPVLSLDGQEFSAAEVREALALIRAKRPAPKSTPAGLLVQRGFDHRLGMWNGEGC